MTPFDRARALMEATGEPGMNETFIYFIQSEQGGPVKVGMAQNPAKRLRELQTGNPFTLEVRRVVIAEPLEEGRIHRLFAAYRMSGEWFRAHPVLAQMGDCIPDRELADEQLQAPDGPSYRLHADARVERMEGWAREMAELEQRPWYEREYTKQEPVTARPRDFNPSFLFSMSSDTKAYREELRQKAA